MRRVEWVLVAACVAVAAPVAAQSQESVTQTPPAAVTLAPRVGVESEPPATISLEAAIQLALEHNPDVTIAHLQRSATAQDVVAAAGAFDLRLTPLFSLQKATNPTVSTIGGGAAGSVAQREMFASAQVAGRTPWAGSRFTVDFSGSRLTTTNQNVRLNPQFPASFGATLVQPLLRNLGIDAERRSILLARRALDLSDAQLTQVVMEQLALVEQAYWELAFATSNVSVQAGALAQARTQVSSNERQVQAGTLAVIDVVEAQTQVATFEQNLASAEEALTEAENRLKSLMLLDREAPLWDRALTPSPLQDRTVPAVALDEAVRMALANRPELAAQEALTAQNAIDQRFFRNQAKPQVDLSGTYSLAGLAGTFVARPPTAGGTPTSLPAFFEGGLPASLSNLFARRYPTAFVQVQMDLPLRNRTAEANVARSVIEGQQLQQQRKQLEQTIEMEVRNALQRVRSAEQRLASAGSAQRSAREQYESEQRRFAAGLSTVFLVTQRQSALVSAQGQELRARGDLNEAIALFDLATGATLTRNGVTVQP
jgi:HAE1 family hydrophobic/amphiphilic exporter-1